MSGDVLVTALFVLTTLVGAVVLIRDLLAQARLARASEIAALYDEIERRDQRIRDLEAERAARSDEWTAPARLVAP